MGHSYIGQVSTQPLSSVRYSYIILAYFLQCVHFYVKAFIVETSFLKFCKH